MAFTHRDSVKDSGKGTTATVDPGVTPNEGDLVVCYVHTNRFQDGPSPTGTIGEAWTTALSQRPDNAQTCWHTLFWKVAGASEPGTYDFSTGGNVDWGIVCKIFSATNTPEPDLAAVQDYGGSAVDLVCGAADGRTINDDTLSVIFGGKDDRNGITYTQANNSYVSIVGNQTNQVTAGAHRIYTNDGETFSGNVTISPASGNDGKNDNTYSIHMTFKERAPLTASGDATLNELTSSGAAVLGGEPLAASGNPSLAELTASGNAGLLLDASGTATLDELTSTGVARLAPKVYLNSTETKSGADVMTVTAFNDAGTSITFTDPSGGQTGSLKLGVENRNENTIAWIDVTVNAATGKTASGDPVLNELTASGTAKLLLGAQGAATLDELTASGTAGLLLEASGIVNLAELTASGTAKLLLGAQGDATLAELTSSGQATKGALTAQGDVNLAEVFSSGQADLLLGAQGAVTLDEVTASGTAGLLLQASGDATLAETTSTGSADTLYGAQGSPTLAELVASGTAGRVLTASGDPTLAELTSSGNAEKAGIKEAQGDATLAELVASGNVDTLFGAQGDVTLAELTASGVATLGALEASGDVTLNELTASGVADRIRPALTASGDATLAEATASGSAGLLLEASGNPTLDEVTSSGTAVKAGADKTAFGDPILNELIASGTAVVRRVLTASGDVTMNELVAVGAANAQGSIPQHGWRNVWTDL